jgi:hypothetical protein
MKEGLGSYLKLILAQIPSLLLLLHLLHRQLDPNSASEDTPTFLNDRALLLETREEATTEEAFALEEGRRFLNVDRADGVQELERSKEETKDECESCVHVRSDVSERERNEGRKGGKRREQRPTSIPKLSNLRSSASNL